jgi:hypothetical protein
VLNDCIVCVWATIGSFTKSIARPNRLRCTRFATGVMYIERFARRSGGINGWKKRRPGYLGGSSRKPGCVFSALGYDGAVVSSVGRQSSTGMQVYRMVADFSLRPSS